MTRAPMFSDIGGGFERLNPELLGKVNLIHQGESAERTADRWKLTRADLDAYSAESHRRAAASRALHAELLPVPGLNAQGEAFTLTYDGGVREQVSPGKMAALKPALRTLQLMGVIPATCKALAKSGLTLADLDWLEINEAFASVVLAWMRELGADPAKVNPWGGAIAHGHPLGASGAGLTAKMLTGLEATEGTLGLQVMCIGHGMATATILERL